MKYRYRPSKQAKKDFACKMEQIDDFCRENGINHSATNDSYYFTLNGVNYRVSNHSIEQSNAKAFNQYGEQVRDIYHKGGRDKNTVYIHASKTRIIEIYNNLKQGFKLNGKGQKINEGYQEYIRV